MRGFHFVLFAVSSFTIVLAELVCCNLQLPPQPYGREYDCCTNDRSFCSDACAGCGCYCGCLVTATPSSPPAIPPALPGARSPPPLPPAPPSPAPPPPSLPPGRCETVLDCVDAPSISDFTCVNTVNFGLRDQPRTDSFSTVDDVPCIA